MFVNAFILALQLIATADLSNERIPVSALELEKHWHVDCKDLLQQYNALVTNSFEKVDLKEMEKLVKEAELCRMIYNVREPDSGNCPDYQTILVMLTAMIVADQKNRSKPMQSAVIDCDRPS